MASGLVLPYLDIPFQHASAKVLQAMKRPGDQDKMLERIRQWRKICPDLTIRSSFILGFPGETEEDFVNLLDWLSEAKLDRVGAFKYEPVAGAAANDLGLIPVAPELQQIRYSRFMQHQQTISTRKLKEKIGKRLSVIIDKAEPRLAEGRSKGDAPGIDGKVHITSRRPLRVGDIVSVKIERSDAYDLFGLAV
jgi:ribosomal protein S12 methylthiotransferase